jgi:hypothetical protein
VKWLVGALIVITCLVLATWAVAGDHRAKLTRVADNHAVNAELAPVSLDIATNTLESTSMLTEIQAVMDSTRRAEKALIEDFGTDQSPELTRRMGELKKSSRMRILQIQLNYARGEGRTWLESRILTCIEVLQRPSTQAAAIPAGGSQR